MKKLSIILFFALVAMISCTKSKEVQPGILSSHEGIINGLFTINENGDQVYFSKGNLQYQASTRIWRFAEHQGDYVGGVIYEDDVEFGNVYENGVKCDNSLISSTYNGWIDLFGWGYKRI